MNLPRSIAAQLLAITLLPASVLAIGFAAFYVTTRVAELERRFTQEGEAIVGQLARTAEFAIASQNPAIIDSTLRNVLSQRTALRTAILRLDGSVSSQQLRPQSDVIVPINTAGSKQFRAPIQDPGRSSFGALATPSTIAYAEIELDASPLAHARGQVWLNTILSVFFTLFAIALLALWHSRRFARPLSDLADVVRKLAAGDLRARVEPAGHGEVRILELGVNNLARAVADSQRNLSERVDQATAALKVQRDEAASASQAKSRFLAAASHDLRQPMHALGLFCSALERRVQDGEQRNLIGNIQTSLRAMEGLFESLLDLSRLDAGRVQANIERMSLDEVFGWIDLEYAAGARDKGLRFRVRRNDNWVQGDITLVRRILMNLTANAIRYTQAGGVLVGLRHRGEIVRIEVWDTGCGIDPASRAAIFEEFVQLDSGHHEKTKGLGLGLAIAKRSAQLLGTTIEVRSRAGRGSVFSFELIGVSMRVAPREPKRLLAATDLGSLIGVRVLVIEDDESGRHAMVALMAQWGCDVRAAEGGAEALAALADRWSPEIIVTDYRLRGSETGPIVVASVEAALGKALPVVVVSGELSLTSDPVAREKLGWAVLRKPATAQTLRAAVQAALHSPPIGAVIE